MAIPDEKLAVAIRTLLQLGSGCSVSFFGMLEMSELENGSYCVDSKDSDRNELWYKDDIALEEALEHFIRIRRERELGYDIEFDLCQKLKPPGDTQPH